MTTAEVRALALRVREALRRAVLRVGEPDTKHDYDRLTLKGYCSVASKLLCLELAKRGETCSIVVGRWHDEWHTWVDWNGHLVDVTATQFGYRSEVFMRGVGKWPKVYVPAWRDSFDYGWGDVWYRNWRPKTRWGRRLVPLYRAHLARLA